MNNTNFIFELVEYESYEIIKERIRDFDINIKDESGFTLLFYACASSNDDNYKICKLLIELGININAKNVYGSTALLHCIYFSNKNYFEICKLFLDNNADINIIDSEDHFALVLALFSFSNDINLIKLLIDYNADILAKYDNKSLSKFARNNEIKDVIKNERKKQKTFNRRLRILFYL
jgi:ankyrin repeat protein